MEEAINGEGYKAPPNVSLNERMAEIEMCLGLETPTSEEELKKLRNRVVLAAQTTNISVFVEDN